MTKTVFFGPFIGEFGWELMSWQGWVRKVCSDTFRDHRKIASSYEGRAALYPDVDEFWPVPKSFEIHIKNSVQYLIKGWRNGLPGSKEIRLIPEKSMRDGQVHLDYREEESYELAHGPDVEPLASAMLDDFRRMLPPDTIIFTPWKYNKIDEGNLEFGLLPSNHPLVNIEHTLPKELRLLVLEIPPQYQSPTKLQATSAGREILADLVDPDTKLIAVFPRSREHYSTSNWPKDKYEKLIVRLQQEFPQIKVAVVGDPEGAYFSDGVPFDTLDLINIDPINRVSVQIAAMERSLFALGSRSGGLCLAYCADCPVFKWSNPNEYGYSKAHRHSSTPEYGYIYPKAQPEVGEIFEAIKEFAKTYISEP